MGCRPPGIESLQQRQLAAGSSIASGTTVWSPSKTCEDLRFVYDDWGNLSEKSSAHGAMQRFTDDCENRLIHAQTWHGTTLHSKARYHYIALGRSIAKAAT